MKIKRIIPLMSIFIGISLTSCTRMFIYDDESQFALANTKVIIMCLEYGKKDLLKRLFAPNIIKRVDDIDEQIDSLFDYWKGEDASVLILKPHYENPIKEKNNGVVIYSVAIIYYIETSEMNYRISILWCRRDDTDQNNEGIWCLLLDSLDNGENYVTIDELANYEVGITLM